MLSLFWGFLFECLFGIQHCRSLLIINLPDESGINEIDE